MVISVRIPLLGFLKTLGVLLLWGSILSGCGGDDSSSEESPPAGTPLPIQIHSGTAVPADLPMELRQKFYASTQIIRNQTDWGIIKDTFSILQDPVDFSQSQIAFVWDTSSTSTIIKGVYEQDSSLVVHVSTGPLYSGDNHNNNLSVGPVPYQFVIVSQAKPASFWVTTHGPLYD